MKTAAASAAIGTGAASFAGSAAGQTGDFTGRWNIPGNEAENTSIVSGGSGTFRSVQVVLTNATESGLASGTISGVFQSATGGTTRFTQQFSGVPLGVTNGGTDGVCDVLFLDIGPITLVLLGLVVEISQITINVDALQGQGILGDLLCGLAGGP